MFCLSLLNFPNLPKREVSRVRLYAVNKEQDQDSIRLGQCTMFIVQMEKTGLGRHFYATWNCGHFILHNPIVGPWLGQPQPKKAAKNENFFTV